MSYKKYKASKIFPLQLFPVPSSSNADLKEIVVQVYIFSNTFYIFWWKQLQMQ